MKTVPITVWIVPIILLAVAILAGINGMHGAAPLPYGYFTFMRIVVCLAAGSMRSEEASAVSLRLASPL